MNLVKLRDMRMTEMKVTHLLHIKRVISKLALSTLLFKLMRMIATKTTLQMIHYSHLKPRMGFSDMVFTSTDYDRTERHLSGIIKKAPCATATHQTLEVIYEPLGKQDLASDCL